jgi:ribosome recycling factor
MGRTVDTYKEVRVFEYPNMTVRVHIPDLTEEERARRMKAIHNAAAELLKSTINNKRSN